MVRSPTRADEDDSSYTSHTSRAEKDNAGVEGFLLDTEQQARMAKKLQATDRYSQAELQYIIGEWNSLKCSPATILHTTASSDTQQSHGRVRCSDA